MSEFKFVQWGKGTPVDYQRLNAMMLNEQYLKDVVDSAPRGILLRRKVSDVTMDPTGGWDIITGLTDVIFDIEEDRLASFHFTPGFMVAGAASQLAFAFVLDGVQIGVTGGTGAGSIYEGSGDAWYFHTEALSKGSHTIGIRFRADGTLSTLQFGRDGFVQLTVRDEGKFIGTS